MSLNWSTNKALASKLKFYTNVSQVNQDGSTIDLQLPNIGNNGQVLSSNGDGTIRWGSGATGLTNPLTETIYPATNNLDLGTLSNPFRKLYVQDQTIELVNTTDPLKSGSVSINNGNIDIKTNLNTANLAIGYQAGVNAGVNSVNLGTESGGNSSFNNCNVGFYTGRQNCGSGVVSVGTQAHQNNAGDRSVAIGFLSGSDLVNTGKNGTASISIGCRAGINTIEDNSIIINATDSNLNNLVPSSFVVKPVRNLTSGYSKILAYDTSSGEIFSSDEKNTLEPVNIATPQVEKNIETKTDNSNAFVVLQPTIGDTELLGGEIRVNNISKINNAKLSSIGLIVNSSATTNSELDSQILTFNNGIGNQGLYDINSLTYYTSGSFAQRVSLDLDTLNFQDPTGLITSNYGRITSNITNASNRNFQTASEIKLNDEITTSTRLSLSKLAMTIQTSTSANSQGATQISITDLLVPNTRSLLNKSSLDIKSSANINSNLSSTNITFNSPPNISNLQSDRIEIKDDAITPETSLLTKSSLTLTSPANNTANSFSSTQLSMIDTSLNRSLLSRLSLQLFSPASTTISTASLNQTNLVIKSASLTPEIATLSNGNLIINSPINNCVSSFSSTTLAMNDIAITHGIAVNKDEFSCIDASQNVSVFNSTSLKLFKSTDLLNPATLLNQTKLEIKSTDDRTTITSTEVKVLNTAFSESCSLVSTGVKGTNIDIFPSAGGNISLTVSASGTIFLNGLPTSDAGLPSGALYIHLSGGRSTICIVP